MGALPKPRSGGVRGGGVQDAEKDPICFPARSEALRELCKMFLNTPHPGCTLSCGNTGMCLKNPALI